MMLGKRKLEDRPIPFYGSTALGHLKPVWKLPLTPTTEKDFRDYRVTGTTDKLYETGAEMLPLEGLMGNGYDMF